MKHSQILQYLLYSSIKKNIIPRHYYILRRLPTDLTSFNSASDEQDLYKKIITSLFL